MKKVFLSLAVLASVAMVSCGKKAAENAEAAEAKVENADSTVCNNDSCNKCDTAVVVYSTVVVDSTVVA